MHVSSETMKILKLDFDTDCLQEKAPQSGNEAGHSSRVLLVSGEIQILIRLRYITVTLTQLCNTNLLPQECACHTNEMLCKFNLLPAVIFSLQLSF